MKAAWLFLLCSFSLLAQGWGRKEARLPWLQGHFPQAEKAFAQTRTALPLFPQALLWEAEFETERARFDHAAELLREAKRIETPDSQSLTEKRRGRLLLSEGHFSDALQIALDRCRCDGTDTRKLRSTAIIDMITVGEVYLARSQPSEAIPIFEEAREKAKSASSQDGWEWSQATNDVAIANLALGRLSAAWDMAATALSAAGREWGAGSIPAIDALDTLGLIYLSEQRLKEADAALTRSRSWREMVYGTAHPKVAASYLHEARLSIAQKNNEEAIRWINLSLEVEKSLTTNGPNGRWALNLLFVADISSTVGETSFAKKAYQTALPILIQELGPGAPRLREATDRYGSADPH